MVKEKSPSGPGRPRKALEDVTHPLAIRLTDRDREALRTLAKKQGSSLSSYIVAVLRRHMTQKE